MNTWTAEQGSDIVKTTSVIPLLCGRLARSLPDLQVSLCSSFALYEEKAFSLTGLTSRSSKLRTRDEVGINIFDQAF